MTLKMYVLTKRGPKMAIKEAFLPLKLPDGNAVLMLSKKQYNPLPINTLVVHICGLLTKKLK